MSDLFSIKNKIIIITGGGGGIGYFLATEMWENSAIVYAIDKKTVVSNKKNFFTVKSDITNRKKISQVCDKIFKNHGKIDVLINNAGITLPKENYVEYPYADWDQTIKTNLTGAFMTAQIVAQYMKKQNSGSIINITSINAELGFPNNPAYVASKGGLKMLTKSLAKDYGKYGIRVNNLGPGYIKTNMTKKSYANKTTRIAREKQTLLGRWGEMSDLIGPCMFLASDASKYITGQDIYVDGGWLANGLVE